VPRLLPWRDGRGPRGGGVRMTYEEAAQRTGHLLRTAMQASNTPASRVAGYMGVTPRHVRKFLSGEMVIRLDRLQQALEACGYELTLSMKRQVEDDDE
jgi:transcriptional regulator with XRE-family HTH domain